MLIKAAVHNNITEAKKDFYTDAIIPLLNVFKENYNNWLVSPYSESENADIFLDYSVADIPSLQEDINKKAQTVSILIEKGVISPNEGREMLNFGRIENNHSMDQFYFSGEPEASSEETSSEKSADTDTKDANSAEPATAPTDEPVSAEASPAPETEAKTDESKE